MRPSTRIAEPSKHRPRSPRPACDHVVQFYERDDFLIDEIGRHVGSAFTTGSGAIVIATPSHREALHRRLTGAMSDVTAAGLTGRYVVLDAADTLAQFMVDGWPDADRFTEVVGGEFERMAVRYPHVHAFGEMVALLWAEGKGAAAIALEKLWNGLAARHSFSLRCAYPLYAFAHHSQTGQFLAVCAEHSDVIPAESCAESVTSDADRRIVAALQQRTQALATEIDEHEKTAKALQDKVEELTLADRRKNEFLAMLGHELRNPLSPILSALQILQLPGADPAATRMANESIAHQTRHLTRIVDGILDVTRVSSGKIELRTEVIDLGSVIRRALDLTGSLIESKHHQVSVGLPDASILVHGDATRLEQVFVNLLTNASKYMSAYGRIAIRAQRSGPDVKVSVEDKGVGLSTELRPRIFELFTQEERSLDRSPGGLGVGLWMVRKLVELHGGSVDAYSEGSGKGTRFVVRLPGAASSSAPTDGNRLPGERAATEAASHRVLVVDDNRDGADNLALLCRMSGHAAEVAYDGIAALELATTFRPDVVLLDIGLPRRDGYEVARELRLASADRLTIIAMTGYGGDADRSRSRDAGFDLHLVKPVEPRWLLDLLSRPIDAMLDANS